MKVNCRTASKILNFLARRNGFETFAISPSLFNKDKFVLRFVTPGKNNELVLTNDVYIAMLFDNSNVLDVLLKLIKMQDKAYIFFGRNTEHARYARLFTSNETLESLCIASDLNET